MVLSSADTTYTHLLINIPNVLDSIASDGIHLQTYQETFLVAKMKTIKNEQNQTRFLPDNVVLNLLLFVHVLVQYVLDDDQIDKIFYLLHYK
jgi:hypothetical protein